MGRDPTNNLLHIHFEFQCVPVVISRMLHHHQLSLLCGHCHSKKVLTIRLRQPDKGKTCQDLISQRPCRSRLLWLQAQRTGSTLQTRPAYRFC